ncbi:MAG TPA: hypothetical protein V6D03_02550 [Candidatus Caenarcaniphilales bacterium]
MAALVVGFYPGSLQAQPSRSATQIRIFTPFNTGGLNIGLAVTDRAQGTCMGGSLAAATRPDAWRCSAGNRIYDPCFENTLGNRNVLACAEPPWTANVVLLRLTAPLPTNNNRADRSKTLPWALELANGQRCTLLTGATGLIAGMRVNYGYADGSSVVGNSERTQPLWKVFFQSQRSLSLDYTEVVVAWF